MGATSTSPWSSNAGIELKFVQSRKDDSSPEGSQVGKRQAGGGTGRYRGSGCGPANQEHEWAAAVTGLLPPARGIGHLATSSKLASPCGNNTQSHLDKRVAGGSRPATIRRVCAGCRAVPFLGLCKS